MSRKSRWRKWFLYIGSVLTAIIAAIAITLTFAQCKPSRALWDPSLPGSRCWDPRVSTDFSLFTAGMPLHTLSSAVRVLANEAIAGWNAFFDISLALMPITIIWHLQIKVAKKLVLCAVLGLGVL